MNNNKEKIKSNKKKDLLKNKLIELEINESFDVNDYINENYNDGKQHTKNNNYYLRRSFDVMFSTGKKGLLTENSEPKEFKCIKGSVTRLK